MSSLKLAYIFDQMLPGKTAESEQLIHTIDALSRCGFDCTLFIPASNVDENPTIELLREFYHVEGMFKVELIHSVFPGPRILQKAVHPAICSTLLRKKLRQFDLVYSRNIPAVLCALAAGVHVMYDTYRPWPEQYHHVLSPLFRYIFSHPLFIGAALHSEYAGNAYLRLGVPAEKTLVAYNGYDPSIFQPVLSRAEARKKLGLDLNTPLAIYSGRMDPEKGIGSLLDLAEGIPECHFIFTGSRGYGPIEQRAASLSNVTVLGWLESRELTVYLYAADVLMLPLSTNPLKTVGNTVLPIKIFTYLAAGRAIFAPDAPDTSELLFDGKNACLTPSNDRKMAIRRFQALIHDEERIKYLAKHAAESAEKLTWDARAQKLERFIRARLG